MKDKESQEHITSNLAKKMPGLVGLLAREETCPVSEG